MKTIRVLFALTMLTCFPTYSFASEIQWSGFMTIAAGKTLDQGDEYIVDYVTNGAYTDELLLTPESMMALQAQAPISDRLRATVQVVAHGANQFDPDVEWAFLSYDLLDNLSINGGRIRLPLYYYSDYLDVGYAYHWVRPPTDVYNIPQSGIEGVSLRYNQYLFDTIEMNLEGWWGNSDLDLPVPEGFEAVGPFKVRDDWGVNAVFNWEWLTLRLLHNELKTSAEYIQESTGDTVGGEESEVSYKSAALMVDYNSLIWRSEYTELDRGAISNSGYGSLGYQIGDWLPHITYSFIDQKAGGFFLPAQTDSYIIGLNWHFSSSAVLKIEYLEREVVEDIFDFATFSTITVETDTPVFSIAVDVVF